MACFHPQRCWFKWDGGRPLFQFPIGEDPLDYVEGVARCRRCIGCKSDRARDVSLRASHEARFIGVASFLTLTYDREHLPWDTLRLSDAARAQAVRWPNSVMPWAGSLRRRDVVLFMKRLRKALWESHRVRVRAYIVGEYGGRNMRPHYHLCLFGFDFRDDRRSAGESKHGHAQFRSARLDALWGMGMCWVNEMGQEVAQYAAKYAVKSQGQALELRMGRDGLVQVPAPFDGLPKGKALGLPFLERWWSDIFPRGLVILKGGIELPAPAAYMKVLKDRDPEAFEALAERRSIEGLKRLEDFMPQRLEARETVAHARAGQSKRDGV